MSRSVFLFPLSRSARLMVGGFARSADKTQCAQQLDRPKNSNPHLNRSWNMCKWCVVPWLRKTKTIARKFLLARCQWRPVARMRGNEHRIASFGFGCAVVYLWQWTNEWNSNMEKKEQHERLKTQNCHFRQNRIYVFMLQQISYYRTIYSSFANSIEIITRGCVCVWRLRPREPNEIEWISISMQFGCLHTMLRIDLSVRISSMSLRCVCM